MDQISRWACPWLAVTIRAEGERIWIDDEEVAIVRDRFLNGRYVRIKFLCPARTRGCRILHARGRTFVCRACAGYEAQRSLGARLGRLVSLRRRIELGHSLHRRSRRKLRKVMIAYEREVAESLHGFVAELNARLGHGRHDANVRNHRGGLSRQRAIARRRSGRTPRDCSPSQAAA